MERREQMTLRLRPWTSLSSTRIGFSHPTDQQVAVAAYKSAREVFSNPVMQKIIVGPEIYPAKHVQTDEEILNTIRPSSNTVYRAAAANKMGRKGDKVAVIDSRCHIYGVERLRMRRVSPFYRRGIR